MKTLLDRRPDGKLRAATGSRRGVLLLVVLSMLTLFMMLGVAYVIMASRAKESSRAFSRALSQEPLADRGDRHMLDRALLLLVRGADPAAVRQPGELKKSDGTPVTTSAFAFESLLEDLYGSVEAVSGQTAGGFSSLGPVCAVDIQKIGKSSGGTVAGPLELTGRIISFVRESGRITSHRILRAESVGKNRYRVFLANHGDVFRRSRPAVAGATGSGAAFDFPPDGTKVVINGRAHSGSPLGPNKAWNEPWDGFDFQDASGNPTNPFLAHLEPDPAKPSSSLVTRFSMFDVPSAGSPAANADLNGDGIPDYCDNDGDGVLDGQFFDLGFAPIPIENGAELRVDVSCLIVDLDGRMNVNAHGSLASLLYPPGSAAWPASSGAGDPLPLLPPGSGYGPAEINARVAFDDLMAARSFSSADDPWLSVFGGADSREQYAAGFSGATPDPGCRTLPPSVGPLEGRYGELARTDSVDPVVGDTLTNYGSTSRSLPGIEGTNDNLAEEQQFLDPVSLVPARPIDLHGHLKHRMTSPGGGAAAGGPKGVVPTMEFFKPEKTDDLLDDPYEADLVTAVAGGRDSNPRTDGRVYDAAPRDNRFGIGELERVLRPYDADTYRLPQRLFALLGSQGEAGRLLLTSESWSIPSITGEAAELLFGSGGWFAKVGGGNPAQGTLFSTPASITAPPTPECLPDGVVPADIAAGLKLDVTPVLHTNLQRRAFFKDLYLLGVAVTTTAGDDPDAQTAARIAQWAANVVEFQDSDSSMTLYEYDPEPTDGWGVDGDPGTTTESPRAVVWGAERPDVIMTQALAWENPDTNEGELYVVLHRPLKSTVLTPSDDPNAPPAAEPIDPHLRGTQPDQVDLGKLTPGNKPVWQLRIGTGGGGKVVRFDEKLRDEPEDPNTLGSRTAPPDAPERKFGPHQWLCVMPSGGGSTVGVAAELEKFSVDIGSLRADPGATEVDIRLERLADPTKDPESEEEGPDYNPYLVVDSMTIPRVVNRRVDPLDPATPLPFEKFTRVGWASGSPGSEQGDPIQMTADWLGEPGWFPWPDRPLIGITELLLVPGFAPNTYRPLPEDDAQAAGLFEGYQPPVGVSYLPDPRLLEMVRVPSRFTGTRLSFPSSTSTAAIADGLAAIGVSTAIRPANQIDIGREPGRVNLNTISTDGVWKAVVQGAVLPNEAEANVGVTPQVPGRVLDPDSLNAAAATPNPADFVSSPAKKVADLLALKANPSPAAPYEDSSDDVVDTDKNPWHRLGTATRLSNVATNRSHVFGIWITIRTVEAIQSQPDPDTVRYARMFVIYDRSKPVAFEPGKDHNVADGILLKRVLP